MDLLKYVTGRVEGDARSGKRDEAHDMKHVLTVLANAKAICAKENGDWSIIEPAALLHDVERPPEDYMHKKYDHAELSSQTAGKLGYGERVVKAIREHSAGKGPKPTTLESRILWDADKLDSFGAMGLARWFILSGENGYTPKQGAENYVKVTEAIGIRPCSMWGLNDVLGAWFYTKAGREMARKDMEYTIDFLKRVLE
jgi:uncharacterized protein